MRMKTVVLAMGIAGLIAMGCQGPKGDTGATGGQGSQGPQGTAGTPYTPPTLGPAPTITLSSNGSALTSNDNLATALNTLGYAFTDSGSVGPTGGAQLIIDGQNGGNALPDWSAHLNSGGHVLITGGSATAGFLASVGLYFTTDGTLAWHRTNACANDWTTTAFLPLLAYVPMTMEFEPGTTNLVGHMTHISPASIWITGTTLLGMNCEGKYIAAVREYPSGGTLTYMLLNIGDPGFITTNDQEFFVTPFIKGYLEWLRTR